jgi:methenyltetrahydromethanopterin cyclohydrolase
MIPLAKMHIEEDIDVSLVTIESENVPLPEVMEQIDLELL